MKTNEINIRDPFVLNYNGKYYMYGTRGSECWADEAYGLDVYVSDIIQINHLLFIFVGIVFFFIDKF